MRGAAVIVSCFLLAACASTTLTPSVPPTPSGPPATPSPCGPPSTCGVSTAPSTPTTGPTTDTGLPTSILGLPVYTVAGINQLNRDRKLDGRFVAVAGYWVQEALPCAYMPHVPAVLGFCNGGRFGDTPEEAQGGSSGAPAPIAVPETVGAELLWQMAGPANDPARVALIVHAADARSWQCAPADRATCASNLVIDRVAWINDTTPDADPNNPTIEPRMTLDEVAAAGVQAGETLVLAYPLLATQLNDVDPRFMGQGSGTVWYLRVMQGAPDADGIATGRTVLVDDASGTVISSLPLTVDAAYNPARLVLDSKGWEATGDARPRYDLFIGDSLVANGWLDSSTLPFATQTIGYRVEAFIGTEFDATHDQGPSCDVLLPLVEGEEAGYYADFTTDSCAWKEGSLFP
jgi:hypothetical protein